MSGKLKVERKVGWVKPDPKIAFTLAEVLITLGIIGVVASLTMPTLIQKTTEQRTISQLSKTYSTLSQAWQRMETEYGTIDTWGISDTYLGKDDDGNNILDYSANQLIAKRLREFLKVVKVCKTGEYCPAEKGYYLNGTEGISKPLSADEEGLNFYLNDGTFVGLGWYNTPHNNMDFNVILPHSKNIVLGKNQFYFTAMPNRIVPEGAPDTFTSMGFSYCNPNSSKSNTGRGCTAWVIYNRNMDYLHCRDKLDWKTKTSCK